MAGEFTCPACGQTRTGKTHALRAFRRHHGRLCGIDPRAAAHRLPEQPRERKPRPQRRPAGPPAELVIPPPPPQRLRRR